MAGPLRRRRRLLRATTATPRLLPLWLALFLAVLVALLVAPLGAAGLFVGLAHLLDLDVRPRADVAQRLLVR